MVKKIIIILLFITSTSFSQNEMEKKIIQLASNSSNVLLLKNKYVEYFKQQKILIDNYHSRNNSTLLQKQQLQQIIDGVPYFYSTDNLGSVTTLRAHAMYPGGSLGLNVTGQGITVGVWDGGQVRNTHQELSGRIVFGDGTPTLSQHSTHVTGTIISQGISPSRRGFAYQANARTYDFSGDISEMVTFGDSGYLVSNHSYGNIVTSFPIEAFGMYNSQSIQVDDIMNAFPYYQIVKSAGNDRNNTTLTQVNLESGYDLLTGISTAKNVLTVAAVNQVSTYIDGSSVVISDFSNFGPPDDGRVKPDISAKGVAVSSTNSVSDTAYASLQGTSMSAPAISGLIVLLQKHYNNLNPLNFMKSASIRGLLCQSAREAGFDLGPDYRFGWGLADGLNAAQVISQKGTSSIFEERTLNNVTTYTTTFTINSIQNINVAIAWTDPIGIANVSSNNDDRTPRLINNLDLKIIKDTTTYYPWKLDPDSPATAATNTGDNNVDNIERVEIFNATPGTYTIQVTHKNTLQNGSQDYTLIASGTNGLFLNTSDFVADNDFFLYPNPANNLLNYFNPNNIELSTISITDITGKQILHLNSISNSNIIDVSILQSGVYFVKFTSENKSFVKKFIKN